MLSKVSRTKPGEKEGDTVKRESEDSKCPNLNLSLESNEIEEKV